MRQLEYKRELEKYNARLADYQAKSMLTTRDAADAAAREGILALLGGTALAVMAVRPGSPAGRCCPMGAGGGAGWS